MPKISDINLGIEQVAGSDRLLVKDVRESYLYQDGKRTKEVDGYRYLCVAPDRKYEELSVKTTKAWVTRDQLVAAKGGMIMVKVKGFQGKFYRTRDGEYAFTATAEALEVVNP